MLNRSDLNTLLWRAQTAEDTLLAIGTAGAGLSAAYPAVGTAITRDVLVASSRPIPDQSARLHTVAAQLTNLAGGATSVSWWLAMDSAGLYAITNEITTTITTSPGTATAGTVVARLDLPYARFAGIGAQGSVYVFAKLNAGTADAPTYRIVFGAPADGGLVNGPFLP